MVPPYPSRSLYTNSEYNSESGVQSSDPANAGFRGSEQRSVCMLGLDVIGIAIWYVGYLASTKVLHLV